MNKPIKLEFENGHLYLVDSTGEDICVLAELEEGTIKEIGEEIVEAVNSKWNKEKPPWYIEKRNPTMKGSKFLVVHSGCYVVGDKEREWGTIYGKHCSGCDEEIPEYMLFQRNLMNDGK